MKYPMLMRVYHIQNSERQLMGASWCNLTDDVTTCLMMTSYVS